MDPVSYTNGSDVYRVEPIEDYGYIDEDFADVYHLLEGSDTGVYISNMRNSVYQGLAIRVYKNDVKKGFMYNYKHNNSFIGGSILVKDVVSLIVMFKHVFDNVDNRYIEFYPSAGIIQFTSILDGGSIRLFHFKGDNVRVYKDVMVTKGLRLFRYFGLEGVACLQ